MLGISESMAGAAIITIGGLKEARGCCQNRYVDRVEKVTYRQCGGMPWVSRARCGIYDIKTSEQTNNRRDAVWGSQREAKRRREKEGEGSKQIAGRFIEVGWVGGS